jgi:hypothetical protein
MIGAGKNVSICIFESCSHQGISRFLHPFPFFTIRYQLCAENSVHKLATNISAVTGLNRLGIDYEAVSQLYDIHAVIGSPSNTICSSQKYLHVASENEMVGSV